MTNITSSTSTEALPVKWIAYLFEQMALMYGKKFTDQWGGTDPARLQEFWAQQLAGYGRDELSRGFTALQAKDWPPSLPEFKRMCRPPLDAVVGYYEAIAGLTERAKGNVGEWSHPAVFWAAASMTHDLLNQTFSQMRDRWEKALKDQLEKSEWAAIPAPMVALPAPGKGKTDREEAGRVLTEFGAMPAPKSDHRAWIGKVLERAKRKDSTLPAISLWMAKEAMKVQEPA
jgi:hypothetical protein